jgi:hypothetical protein
MIEMAPETAKRCKEKRDGRCLSIGRAVRRGRSQPFRRPQDVVHLPGYFVAKDLKAGWLPAPSLSRIFLQENASKEVAHGLVQKVFNFLGPCAVSGQMASHHFDQINRS